MTPLIVVFEGSHEDVASAKERLDAKGIPRLIDGGHDWSTGFALRVTADREAEARAVLAGFSPHQSDPELSPQEYRRRQRLLLIFLGIALLVFALLVGGAFWLQRP